MSEQDAIRRTVTQPSAPSAVHASPPPDANALHWLVGILCITAAAALAPFWAPLLLAAWGAHIVWPLQQRLAKGTRHRNIAAATLTTLLVIALVTPFLIAVLSLWTAAITLGQRLAASASSIEALKALTTSPASDFDFRHLDPKQALALVQRHGAGALIAARNLFGALTLVALEVVVLLASFYTFLAEGRQAYDWLLERAPLSHANFHRLANVVGEVGRGLLIGMGLTALAQGSVATIGYVMVGVPEPLVLGLLTTLASLIPSVGSALIWVPVTAGLALSGRTGAAGVMLGIGLVVSIVDNLLRPLFARYAALRLHTLVLFLAMLGGLVLFGGWGLLLGPLFVRLASEGLTMLCEQRTISRA